ncbi:hypothetical protein BS78_10G174400 [Paspalum vaginatum]|nr:hypothetical protein BS78_10G174400 [Paspalum vaginatum]
MMIGEDNRTAEIPIDQNMEPMTNDERRHPMAAEEGCARAVSVQSDSRAGLPTPAPKTEKKAVVSEPPAPVVPAKSLAQAEEGIAVTKELLRAAKAKESMEFGAVIAASGASMMVAWYFLAQDARGAHNLHYIIPMFLAFACFISGFSLMLLSMNILELREDLIADVQDVASHWLSLSCTILPVLTLLSTFVFSGNKIYRYIGLAILGLVISPLALLRWYIGHKAEGGDQQADKEHKEQLEAAFKFISAISNSAIGGLVALVVNYNVTGGSGSTKGSILVAIFILFTTAISGLLSMEIRTKVLEIHNSRLRGSIIKTMWSIIIFMLLLLAGAVLAEVFAIVEFWIFAAFPPWLFASVIYLFLEGSVRVPRNNVSSEYLVEQFNWKADKGIKITMWSFMAIISIFGGFLHGHDKIQYLKACIVLLTSAFMSGFVLTLLSIRPDPTSTSLAAATTILDWTASVTFGAAIFAVLVAMVLEIQHSSS